MEDLFTFAARTGFQEATTKDATELQTAAQRVYRFMADGEWHTSQEIAEASGVWSGDRRMRDLRQLGYKFDKRHDGRTYSFRLIK